MENFEEYKTTGLLKQGRNMPNCVSTGFDCQASEKQTTASEVIQTPYEVSTPISPSIPQPTNIPIKQSFEAEECLIKDGDTCLKTDVLDTESDTIFCICCLEDDVSYVKVVTCEHAEFLYSLVMPEIKPKNQVICYQCHHMLKKIKLFKLQVEESFKLLSNSLETKPKRTDQIHTFKVRQNYNINIQHKAKNMERARVYAEVPQFRTKYYKDNDGNITEEVIESIDTTEKRPKPRSPDKLAKKSKNIEQALKIINSNQNSDCISVLTNSLKNISSTLLSDFLINFDIGSQIDKTIKPETNEENNITATLKEKNIDAKEKHAFQNDAPDVTSKLAITTENLATPLGENSSNADTSNLAKNLTQGNLTTKIAEALIEDSIKASTDLKRKIKNSIDNTTSTVMSKENLATNTVEGTTNNYNENKHLTLEDIGKGLLLPKVKPKISEKTTENPVQKDPVIDEIIGRIKTEHYAMVENDSSGGSSQIVTEKESVGFEKEEAGGGEICSAVESTIALATQPSLGSNIKQLTLTRTQLMDERIKTATSQAYLRAPHRCTSCLIGFQFQENLEDHVKRKHTEGKIQAVECDICHQLMDPSGYEMHKFWHLTRYQCVACEQLFASHDRAVFHYRKQHVKRLHLKDKQAVVFRCPRCAYKTSRRRLLKHHMSECRPSSTNVTLDTSLTNTAEAPSEAKRAKFLPTATG